MFVLGFNFSLCTPPTCVFIYTKKKKIQTQKSHLFHHITIQCELNSYIELLQCLQY